MFIYSQVCEIFMTSVTSYILFDSYLIYALESAAFKIVLDWFQSILGNAIRVFYATSQISDIFS